MKNTVRRLLEHADIRLNGNRRWDLQVHEEAFYRRVVAGGSLALGETYMDGWWDCEALDEFFYRIFRADIPEKAHTSWPLLWQRLKAHLLNLQNKSRAYEVGEQHYDRGNDLFRRMLDKRMVYSCGYWKEADTLEEAQDAYYEVPVH
jgi:cyclopropane-fatty-acyl-phospholipid synthase